MRRYKHCNGLLWHAHWLFLFFNTITHFFFSVSVTCPNKLVFTIESSDRNQFILYSKPIYTSNAQYVHRSAPHYSLSLYIAATIYV